MKSYRKEYQDPYFRMVASYVNSGYYRYLGKGSGRIVFDMYNGNVVKAAKNVKGLAQNLEEFRIALTDDSGLFARISDVSEDYRYLIMEKADRIVSITEVWDYFHVKSNRELYQVGILRELADRYGLLIHDLGRVVNWGKIGRRPVIIDYGFTHQVRKKYYASK